MRTPRSCYALFPFLTLHLPFPDLDDGTNDYAISLLCVEKQANVTMNYNGVPVQLKWLFPYSASLAVRALELFVVHSSHDGTIISHINMLAWIPDDGDWPFFNFSIFFLFFCIFPQTIRFVLKKHSRICVPFSAETVAYVPYWIPQCYHKLCALSFHCFHVLSVFCEYQCLGLFY